MEQNSKEENLSISAKWENIFNSIDICLWVMDATNLDTIHISFSCQKITGYTQEDFYTYPDLWKEMIHPHDKNYVISKLPLWLKGKSDQLEYRILDKKGEIKWISDSIMPIMDPLKKIPVRLKRVIKDISPLKNAEEQLQYISFHDPLTGLFNRKKLVAELNQAIIDTAYEKKLAAIVLIDIDRFKFINETLGHQTGDKILQIISKRIKNRLRKTDITSRLGDDEFVIVLKMLTNRSDIEKIAKKIHQVITLPINIKGNEYNISASIGISIFPDHADNPEGLIQHAYQAMDMAKETRKGIQIYQKDSYNDHPRKLLLEQGLHKAIDNNEFFLEYQPIVDVYKKQIIGLEALIRWRHPVFGIVSPVEFINIAEESDLIIKVGDWVLKAACSHLVQWKKKNLPQFYISVNVSGKQIQKDDFTDSLKDILNHYNIPRGSLKIEITETAAMTNVTDTLTKLNELQNIGVEVYMDDFGTGYSSLSYLVKFPFNALKIDRSFVMNLNKHNQKTISRTIVAMAKSLKLNVVAEGVEEVEQFQYLCSIGCSVMQGYYFSKPVPADVVEKLFSEPID